MDREVGALVEAFRGELEGCHQFLDQTGCPRSINGKALTLKDRIMVLVAADHEYVGQVGDARVSRSGVGERDHRRRVEKTVGREQLGTDVELGVDTSGLEVHAPQADESRQATLAPPVQCVEIEIAHGLSCRAGAQSIYATAAAASFGSGINWPLR